MTVDMGARYGSDHIVDILNTLGIEYVALNPGATFRGIHESIINYGGNSLPEVIECPHEEIAVAICHGYAKACGKPMVAMVHDIVGLLHASMAIYNSWCDRIPMLIIGGTGPMDAVKRRPWIDWIHTALVQGNAIRDFVKWDDQPASIESFANSIIRGWRLAVTEPKGPVYLCFDWAHQEAEMPSEIPVPDIERYAPPSTLYPDPKKLEQAARWLVAANSPVIIVERTGRKPETVTNLIELVDLLAVPVIDKIGHFNFPSIHPLDLTGAEQELLPAADLVFALDVNDLYGALNLTRLHLARTSEPIYTPLVSEKAKIMNVSLKEQLVHSWSSDFQFLPEVDLPIAADSAEVLKQLIPLCRQLLQQEGNEKQRKLQKRKTELQRKHDELRARWKEEARLSEHNLPISLASLSTTIWEVIKNEDWVLVNDNFYGWARRLWDFQKPHQYLGVGSGGGGLGYGLSASIGAALAYRNTNMLCIDLQSDGDFLYSPQALWTAAHHKIPLLIIMNNNRSYFNSENHLIHLSTDRGRSIESSGIGTTIVDPIVDISALARSLGIYAKGPFERPDEIKAAIEQAIQVVKNEKKVALIDVFTEKESKG